jgi:magnesium transporter
MDIKKFLPPGTIFNTSNKENVTNIKRIYYTENEISVDEPIENSTAWIRVNGLSETDLISEELKKANVDSLVIEDIFNLTQRSKIEEIDNGFFAIIKTSTINNNVFVRDYFSIILKDNYVFTFNEKPIGILNIVEDRISNSQGKIRKFPAKYLFYTIIDMLIDVNIVFEHQINELLADWEDKIVNEKVKQIEFLHQIRKEIIVTKANINSLVESIDMIGDIFKTNPVLELKKYYQDLLDHLYRLNERMNLNWEEVKTLYELHMNNINERTNSIMKVLTIFSAIFIPLSFMAGVFGMNFVNMEILNDPNGIWIFVSICVVTLFLMLGFFKYKKWL